VRDEERCVVVVISLLLAAFVMLLLRHMLPFAVAMLAPYIYAMAMRHMRRERYALLRLLMMIMR